MTRKINRAIKAIVLAGLGVALCPAGAIQNGTLDAVVVIGSCTVCDKSAGYVLGDLGRNGMGYGDGGGEARENGGGDPAAWWSDLLEKPKIPAGACSAAYPVPREGKDYTSRDDAIFRKIAAGAIMQAHFRYTNTVGANGQKFSITYSDGGSEDWVYATASPASPKNDGNLKQGDGVPKC